MDDGDRIGILYNSLKSSFKDQFVVEKVLSECTESELRVLEDLCSRCADYQQQDFFVAPDITPVPTWKTLFSTFLGRSKR